jgi:hypothetical protein
MLEMLWMNFLLFVSSALLMPEDFGIVAEALMRVRWRICEPLKCRVLRLLKALIRLNLSYFSWFRLVYLALLC